ncbi:unnamed protein product [Rhizophagus irregularis]|nr:unnamed protein product [Rhizophagus irregularis]
MNDIRNVAEKTPRLKNELKESLNPTITLLNDLFKRLQLKDKNFETFEAASEFDMNVLWDSILRIDSTLTKEDKNDEKKILVAYLDTICYTCGATFALSNKLELEDEPVKESSRKRNIEASENDNILSDVESEEEIEVSDEEFISTEDNVNIGTKRDDIDRELKNVLSKVFVNAALECYDEMEKAYYSANFLPICFNCGSPEYVTPVPEKQYPYCETCTTDPNVLIKTGRELNFSSNSIQSGERKEKRSKRK